MRHISTVRRVRSLRGRWRAHYTPKLKKRTALLAKLKDVFRRHQSQPADRVIKLINPVLRGWVNWSTRGSKPHSRATVVSRSSSRKGANLGYFAPDTNGLSSSSTNWLGCQPFRSLSKRKLSNAL